MTKLREKRLETGISQAEMAYQARVSAPFACDLEAGRRNAKMDTWERIADVLGCTVDEIKPKEEQECGTQ